MAEKTTSDTDGRKSSGPERYFQEAHFPLGQAHSHSLVVQEWQPLSPAVRRRKFFLPEVRLEQSRGGCFLLRVAVVGMSPGAFGTTNKVLFILEKY